MSLGKRYAILAALAVVLVAGALVVYFSGDSRAREKPAAKGPAAAPVAVTAGAMSRGWMVLPPPWNASPSACTARR